MGIQKEKRGCKNSLSIVHDNGFSISLFPIALCLCELLRDPWRRNDGYLLSIYLLIVILYSYLRFFPTKRILSLDKKFDKNNYNHLIPDWSFFLILPLSIAWGISAYILLVKFLINPFALRGIVYNIL